jgi:HK97 gp10 family phage protein
MRSFDSFGAFAEHLVIVAASEKIALHEGLKKAAELIEATARAEIGVYQGEVGTFQDDIGVFPAWAPLAESTERQKERMGYALDAPLLASGDMRESFSHQVVGLKAVIGSDDPIAVYHETGTENMPPRPVFGPAAVRNEDKVLRILTEAAAAGLIGGDWMHAPISKD